MIMKKKLIECYRCHKKSEKLYKLTIFKPEDFIKTEVKMCKTCKEILHIIHGVFPKSL